MKEPIETRSRDRWWWTVVACVIVLGAWVLIFARTVDRDLNHDEHQFLAPAALVGREGLQPWRDFPLYHLSNLVFAYAWADRLTGNLVLGAKLVNFAASAAMILALVALAKKRPGITGILVGLMAVLLLLSDPLYRYTAGKTWNHEVPTALLIAAGLSLVAALRRDSLFWTALAGICGGLAVGCRLTFAPTLIGLFVFVWFFPMSWKRRLFHAAVLTATATAALSPTLYYLIIEPNRFVFSNLEFPRLRLSDPSNTRVQKTASLWRKIRYFFKEIVLPCWPVFLLWATVAIRPGWLWLRTRRTGDPIAGLCLIVLPFVLIGCFTPTRYQFQHYFVIVPVLLTATASASIYCSQVSLGKILMIGISFVGCFLSIGRSIPDYAVVRSISRSEEWFPSRIERQGLEIRSAGVQGRVLTLAPTIPLAAGLKIYPEFSTGTFGWRSASLVVPERRHELHLVAPEDLAAFLAPIPPAAVLTGVEEEDEEAPFITWAQENGFKPLPLRKKRVLWVAPARF